jgi:Holliday junction resolvasome RuvABC endonuclease subunit
MRGLGIACSLDGRPIVTGVIAERGDDGTVVAQEVLRHVADRNDDEPSQLRAIADHIESRMRDLAPDAVVVRSVDWFPNMNRATVRRKYVVEGAVTVEVRRHVDLVEALPGRDIGTRCGSTKAEVEAEASALVGDEAKDAGAAALAALAIAEG